MILVSTLYDEYIDRPKLTEQKKTPKKNISSPPQEGSEQLYLYFCQCSTRKKKQQKQEKINRGQLKEEGQEICHAPLHSLVFFILELME